MTAEDAALAIEQKPTKHSEEAPVKSAVVCETPDYLGVDEILTKSPTYASPEPRFGGGDEGWSRLLHLPA